MNQVFNVLGDNFKTKIWLRSVARANQSIGVCVSFAVCVCICLWVLDVAEEQPIKPICSEIRTNNNRKSSEQSALSECGQMTMYILFQ